MHAYRAIGIAFLLSAMAAGCSSSSPIGWLIGRPDPPAEATATTPQTSPATATLPPDAPAPSADAPAPDALAAKVASYRNDVEGQLNHPAAANASSTTQPAIASATQPGWLSAEPIRLTPYAADNTPVAPGPSAASVTVGASPRKAAATNDTNFPLTVPETADRQAAAELASSTDHSIWKAEEVEHKLATHLRDYPADLEGQLDYEMLLFVEGQPVPQMSALAGLRDEDREVLSSVMDGLSNFRNVIRADNNLLLAAKVKPLLDMSDRLRSQSELTLPTVALCTQVDSYGVYKPVESDRFVAGKDNKVIVYIEVQNFQSNLTADNQWQTKLNEEMVLYTETGMPAWPAKSQPEPVVDLCRQRRHDFFIRKLVALPKNLTIGRYLMKITVTDEQANHVAEATTPLEIVAE